MYGSIIKISALKIPLNVAVLKEAEKSKEQVNVHVKGNVTAVLVYHKT